MRRTNNFEERKEKEKGDERERDEEEGVGAGNIEEREGRERLEGDVVVVVAVVMSGVELLIIHGFCGINVR